MGPASELPHIQTELQSLKLCHLWLILCFKANKQNHPEFWFELEREHSDKLFSCSLFKVHVAISFYNINSDHVVAGGGIF